MSSYYTINGMNYYSTSVDPSWLTQRVYYTTGSTVNYQWNTGNADWQIVTNPYKIKKELNKNIEVL